jgi:hypothetical protein
VTPIQLEHIKVVKKANGGKLTAQSVLTDACNPNSPLHGLFTWDDSEAAISYRLIQAAGVIRVAVRFVGVVSAQPQRARVRVQSKPSHKTARDVKTLDKDEMLREEIIRLEIHEAEIAVEVSLLESEREWVAAEIRRLRAKLPKGDRVYNESDGFAAECFTRGVPLKDIIMIANDLYAGAEKNEEDMRLLQRNFGLKRPDGWNSDLAQKQWGKACEIGFTEGAFGLFPYGERRTS